MIVRINQFDAIRPEAEAGWPGDGRLGPLLAPWPADVQAYEVLILEHDEQGRPLATPFRQQQIRQLIPQAVAAFREPGEEIVVRLDGPLADRELLPAYRRLTEPTGHGRFATSPVQKLDALPGEVLAGVRIQPTVDALQSLCGDAALGLERSVRLRVFCVPERLVNAVVDMDAPGDERWGEVLEHAGFVLGSARGLLSLQLLTARFDTAAVKGRLMRRLAALAQGAPAAAVG